jgi:rhodanese-related sulfurtransferase
MAMTTPFADLGLLGDGASLTVALILGIGFGVFLEQGGLGDAKKLAAQFYLTDLTVLKVLFTAIVTAMLGLFWLGRLGMLDLGRVYLLPTFAAPQLVGGLVFGVGFVMGGLCPGTSCVALSSGKLDGLALLGGMLLGIVGFNEAYPLLRTFYQSTPRGQVTLAQLAHVPHGVMVLLVTLGAVASFVAAGRIEAVHRGRAPGVSAPFGRAALSRRLAGAALLLGLGAAVAGNPYGVSERRQAARISAVDLAQWLRERRDVRIVDLRSQTAFDTFHVPRAERATAADLTTAALGAGDTLVVYGAGDGSALRVWESLWRTAATVRYMSDGVAEWVADVLNPTLAASATPAQRRAFERVADLSRYFGGDPRTGVVGRDSLGTAELLHRAERRGCAF